MSDSNSGFLGDDEVVGGYSLAFSDIEVVALHGRQMLAMASRYGRRWLLKGIRKEYADSTPLRQQLLKEAEILASLSHPGVVAFAGVEEVEGLGLCIVMEWIEGPTLEEALSGGRLSKADRKRLLLEIVEAAAYIHSKGIVHRDLKPSNIMVRQNGGKAVIIDFGLSDTDSYTILKNPAGTQGYMSERQQKESTPSAADDVYSIGIIMRSLYPEYAAIVRRCTGKPSRRPADAGKLLQAIRNIERRDRRALAAMALSAAAIALTVIALLLVHSQRLASSMSELGSQLDSVSVNADQERHQRIALADSLRHLGAQLDEEREFNTRIKEHDAMMLSTKQCLKDRLERTYRHFLHDYPTPTYGDPQAALKLIEEMTSTKDALLGSIPGLTDDDRVMLEQSFAIYQGEILHRWAENQNQ